MKFRRPDLAADRAPRPLTVTTGEHAPIHASAAIGPSGQVMQFQRLAGNRATVRHMQNEARPRTSSLPNELRAGLERMSGIAMDDVRVHHGSAEPDRLGAAAFTRGADIHLAPGEDRHLAHEAWHVVQQKQGRVDATARRGGHTINDRGGLEREADAMGTRALAAGIPERAGPLRRAAAPGGALQCKERKDRWSQTVGEGRNRTTLYFTLTEKTRGQAWRLKIYSSMFRAESSKLGSVELKISGDDLSIDSMHIVADEQGSGLGSLLTENAVKAVAKNMVVQGITAHGGIDNIVSGVSNPIMLNAMAGRMMRQYGHGDMVDDEAFVNARQAVVGWDPDTPLTGKSRTLFDQGLGNNKFELDRFPTLWGRMVYLAKHDGIVFSVLGLDMTADESNHLDVMLKLYGMITGKVFQLTVRVPPPPERRRAAVPNDT